jgi:hypothetical protein
MTRSEGFFRPNQLKAAVRDVLLREIFDPAMDTRLHILNEKVEELLTPYTREFPATLNRQFVAKVRELREKRATEKQANASENDDMDLHACSELLAS